MMVVLAHFRRMRFTVLLIVLLLSTGGPAADEASPNSLSAEERAAGWRLLFDGKSTAGWRGFRKKEFPAEGWAVRDGCLLLLAKGGGDIITTNQLSDYEFRFDWKLSAGANSGVKYFITEERREAVGHEYQLLAASGPAKGQTGALYDLIAPSTAAARPLGEWNASRIIVRGRHVEHWLNGVKLLAYELGSPELDAAIKVSKFRDVPGFGTKFAHPLLLQDHDGEVWFRNLKVLESKE